MCKQKIRPPSNTSINATTRRPFSFSKVLWQSKWKSICHKCSNNKFIDHICWEGWTYIEDKYPIFIYQNIEYKRKLDQFQIQMQIFGIKCQNKDFHEIWAIAINIEMENGLVTTMQKLLLIIILFDIPFFCQGKYQESEFSSSAAEKHHQTSMSFWRSVFILFHRAVVVRLNAFFSKYSSHVASTSL